MKWLGVTSVPSHHWNQSGYLSVYNINSKSLPALIREMTLRHVGGKPYLESMLNFDYSQHKQQTFTVLGPFSCRYGYMWPGSILTFLIEYNR